MSITNFVFDMGGVLMDFNPELYSHLYVDNDQDALLIRNALFLHPSWALLDSGTISDTTMEMIAQRQLPERLWEPLHQTCMHWHEHHKPLPLMNQQVERLHAAGYGCFLLSNAGVRWWKIRELIPCMPLMDGFVVSAFERIMKPDPLIFTTLCERYQLEPTTCLFIDDNADNCAGAEVAGMTGYVYNGDVAAFENYVSTTLGIAY